MPSTPRPDGPRHLAGNRRRSVDSTAGDATVAPTSSDVDAAEAPRVVRVHRSRLALALAATIAALPILVLDNLPATANATEQVSTANEVAVTQLAAPLTTVPTPTTTAAPATTVAPPTTAAAPSTTAAPRSVAAVASPAPPTTQAPPRSGANGDPNDPATWDRMAECEAHGNWSANTGNGYYGGLQFSVSTWEHYGGTGYPHQASKATQIQIGKRLQAARGWGAWPACSEKLGYT
ncbi:MAG: transglycosylase family protein [Acidimicrobiales bacterium]